jgi:hypothetical protein
MDGGRGVLVPPIERFLTHSAAFVVGLAPDIVLNLVESAMRLRASLAMDADPAVANS